MINLTCNGSTRQLLPSGLSSLSAGLHTRLREDTVASSPKHSFPKPTFLSLFLASAHNLPLYCRLTTAACFSCSAARPFLYDVLVSQVGKERFSAVHTRKVACQTKAALVDEHSVLSSAR